MIEDGKDNDDDDDELSRAVQYYRYTGILGYKISTICIAIHFSCIGILQYSEYDEI